jgi:hypothetical protein
VHVETHRDRMTTDLFFTLQLLECFPDLRLTADISHYVVGREFAWPISDENHALMHRILDNSWGIHGRVASREQIQVQLDFPQHQGWVALFMGWWEYAIRSWRRRAGPDAVLTFLCELGPPTYAISGAAGALSQSPLTPSCATSWPAPVRPRCRSPAGPRAGTRCAPTLPP